MFDVFDLHCDTVDRIGMAKWEPYLSEGGEDGATLWHNHGHLSLDRTDGMRWTQCFAIWIPENESNIDPLSYYREARDWFGSHMLSEAEHVGQARSALDIADVLGSGRSCAILTVEGGTPIGNDLSVVDEMAADGVRMLTLTWNGPNTIASGHNVPDQGITEFGAKAVRALEDNGIIVDVSHLNDKGFSDLLGIATKPFVASHSNVRAVCPHKRNLTDDQFRAIRDLGGIVGLNYYTHFVHPEYGSGASVTTQNTTFEHLCMHVEHMLDLGGEDTLALGSDYDGSDVPTWLDGCEKVMTFHDMFEERFGKTIATKVFAANARDFFVRYERA